jgi:hypothetical protein
MQQQQQPFEYRAHDIMLRAANDNHMPKKELWKKLLKISLWVAPIAGWLFLWAN